MREIICFHLFPDFLAHTRSVAQAYARGLHIRHPPGIRGLDKAFNFMVLQFQIFLFGILELLIYHKKIVMCIAIFSRVDATISRNHNLICYDFNVHILSVTHATLVSF